jgi:hypothetical protein
VRDGDNVVEMRVVDVYGKLAKVAPSYGNPYWISLADDFQTPRRPGPDPDDEPADFEVGDRVRAPLGSLDDKFDGKVAEVYGKMVRIDFISGSTGWAEASDVEPTSDAREKDAKKKAAPKAKKRPRKGRRRRRPKR